MKNTLRSTLTAILLSSIAVVPAATIGVVASADAAYAKSDKAKGGGGGGKSKASSDRGGKKSDRGGNTSRSGKKERKAHGGFERLFGKGKSKKSERSAVKSSAQTKKTVKKAKPTLVATSPKAPPRPAKDFKNGMHPRDLGKVNGMLNANENAILAHIRNGNTNGPIGLMAAATVAKYNADGADTLLDSNLAAEYAALDDALADNEFGSLQEYRDSGETIDEIDMALAEIGQSDLDAALGDYETYDDYLAAVESDESLRDEELESAFATVEAGYDPQTAQSIDDAQSAVGAYDDAIADILDAWNKGDADSENADDVVAAIETRIDSYENVESAINGSQADTCDGDETCDVDDEVVDDADDVEEIDEEEIATVD